jgi:hypothetical protein
MRGIVVRLRRLELAGSRRRAWPTANSYAGLRPGGPEPGRPPALPPARVAEALSKFFRLGVSGHKRRYAAGIQRTIDI